MPAVKIDVIYPYPTDVEEFENVYVTEHLPLAAEKIKGMSRFVVTKVLSAADGSKPPFYRLAELHFPSPEALQEAASSAGGQETVAHAIEISSGGAPLFLVAEEKDIEI
ncbi:MAG TPA: EthD family reductase [Pyrinomonadaceae bacterium]